MASAFRGKIACFGRKYVNSIFNSSIKLNFQEQRLKWVHTSRVFNVPGQEVKMPSLSPTMTEGKIVKWMKKEGDTLTPGDVLCEIQTDKAIMSFETEEEGILAKILVGENSADVKVGTLIALTVAEGEDWTTVEMPGQTSVQSTVSPPASTTSTGTVPGQEIKMPSLSPTMTEGTIINWMKKEGDSLSPGDVLCEIQTDKAVMSFETEEEGILAKILVAAGTKDVKVGTMIALTVAEGEDWKDVMVPGVPAASTSPVTAENMTSQPTFIGGNVPGQELKMPSLSPTMTEGTIVSWVKKEGEKISPGDVLCEIQTDKAVMSFETEEEGILAKILVPDGTKDVKVGQLIALIVNEGEDWRDVAVPVAEGISTIPTVLSSTASPKTSSASQQQQQNFGPAVLRLLEQYQLMSTQITPTGRNKKLLKGDVLKYIANNNLQPKPPKAVPPPGQIKAATPFKEAEAPIPEAKPRTGFTDHELSNMRKTIAKRLTLSKTEIPHAYNQMEAQIDSLLGLRKQLAQVGVKVSVNDFVIKAVALALHQCPFMNTLFINNQAVSQTSVDVSIAVATDSGLITPIIKSANFKSVDQISAEVKDLAAKARQGKLQLHEFQGGTFTISNLGMFGVSEFSAIINPPQCGILAVGGGRSEFTGDWQAVTLMTSTLSYDARAVAEDEVAEFMYVLQSYLHNPATLMLPPQSKIRIAQAQS